MHRFRDMTTYCSKIAEKTYTPLSFGTFLRGDPLRIFRRLIPCQKLESWGYQTVYISRSCFRCARHNTGVWQTDGRIRRCRKDRAMHSVAQVKSIQQRNICTGFSVMYCTPYVHTNIYKCRSKTICKCFGTNARYVATGRSYFHRYVCTGWSKK